MPKTGTPSLKTRSGARGEPSSHTLAGPPDRMPGPHIGDRLIDPTREAEHAADVVVILLYLREGMLATPLHLARESDLRAVELIERQKLEGLGHARLQFAGFVLQRPTENLVGKPILRLQLSEVDGV